ncbi:hypothetical protein KY328_03495 [Candidatus Woesearchaeota archaeon]|nr:hypothetical protein [Candidatus Woesearchaeota archaeon]MBW3021959.1 hypothetical protein [Candidatus Woesearchaeota archaeon]
MVKNASQIKDEISDIVNQIAQTDDPELIKKLCSNHLTHAVAEAKEAFTVAENEHKRNMKLKAAKDNYGSITFSGEQVRAMILSHYLPNYTKPLEAYVNNPDINNPEFAENLFKFGESIRILKKEFFGNFKPSESYSYSDIIGHAAKLGMMPETIHQFLAGAYNGDGSMPLKVETPKLEEDGELAQFDLPVKAKGLFRRMYEGGQQAWKRFRKPKPSTPMPGYETN